MQKTRHTRNPIDADVTIYHRTSENSANVIVATRRWISKENPKLVYFSTVPYGQASGYGDAIVAIDIDPSFVNVDDEFPDGELHLSVLVSDLHRLAHNYRRITPFPESITQEQLDSMNFVEDDED